MAFSSAELSFLLADCAAGSPLINDATTYQLTKKSLVQDLSQLRKAHGDHARALVELVQARRAGKLPEDWLMDSESTQQATPPVVAAWRAEALKGAGVEVAVDVTCSIGTELHALAEAGLRVLGGDLDQQRLRMARFNVPEVPVVRMDALRPAFAFAGAQKSGVVVADPARRNSSGRIAKLEDLQPPLPELMDCYDNLVVKCAPGIDYSEFDGHVEVVSVDGGVKETCLYSPGILGRGRQAVVMGASSVKETVSSDEPETDRVGGVGRYIVDPDGAIVRAGLVRQYAARHGLWQLDPHIAYLTGDELPAGVRGFEVLEAVPLKKARPALVGLGAKSVEILVRGVDVDPDELRKKWKLKKGAGSAGATHSGASAADSGFSVVVTRVGEGGAAKAVAYICRARRSSRG
ncbi:class I SAM-dependent methyltransferase [Corynebacterium sp. c9Ua_112]|uniref:Class I SAM-dependent methyltransferase n=1 Tax=Corynebacterium macclintockiae TaxID=2913501 RepID=A0A9X3M797_9CORY|nr:SAM-dependent methyltransferase [Corynebacterium macclintockiae]MCZ9304018.1 class I SAM-dependent methyltransferase [Corynebacterium macclintockiae]